MNTANPLDHSRPIRWDRTLVDPAKRAFLDHLEGLLTALETRKRRRKPEDHRRFQATLQALVADLLAASWDDPTRWLVYGRRTSDYPGESRYRSPLVSYQAVCDVADLLVQTKLADGELGFYDRSHHGGMVNVGRRSRIRATDALLALATSHGLSPASIAIAPASETILLRGPKEVRGKPGPLEEYEDTEETLKFRETLDRVNALLEATSVTLDNQATAGAQLQPAREDDEEPLPTDRTAQRLYRVFNDGSFDRGGRFYGWWQGLKKEGRQRFRINGEPVIELDFSGMHPRLCYALDGQPLSPEVDPYAIPGLEGADTRDLVKRGFNQLLNGTEETANAPPGCAEQLPPGMRWHQLMARIEDHHRSIGHWLRCRRGLDLQAIDAGIAEQVLSFLAHKGIPCLPVHDSFIVARRHEDRLGETMMLAWHGQIRKHGGNPGVPPIKGWSSPEIAQRVTLRVAS